MREKYKETFDGVHASQQLKTEVMNVKREENVTKRRKVPAAALAAALLTVVLAGTAVAVEIINRVEVGLVNPDETGVSTEGYSLQVKFSPIPLESLSDEALERFARGEGGDIQRYEGNDGEYVSWTHHSWAEAEAFLGLDLGRNPLLEQYPEVYLSNSYDPDEGTCWVGGVLADDEGTKIPAGFDVCSGYQIEDCHVQVMAELRVDSPAAAAFPGTRAGIEHEAFQYVDAGTVEGCYTTEDKQFSTEEYTAASGLTAIIVSRSDTRAYDPDDDEWIRPDSTAYFARENAWFSIECVGPDCARETAMLKQILDAYE